MAKYKRIYNTQRLNYSDQANEILGLRGRYVLNPQEFPPLKQGFPGPDADESGIHLGLYRYHVLTVVARLNRLTDAVDRSVEPIRIQVSKSVGEPIFVLTALAAKDALTRDEPILRFFRGLISYSHENHIRGLMLYAPKFIERSLNGLGFKAVQSGNSNGFSDLNLLCQAFEAR